MFVQPVLVYQADAPALRRAYERALGRDVSMAIYTADLFETGHDEANRAAVARRAEEPSSISSASRVAPSARPSTRSSTDCASTPDGAARSAYARGVVAPGSLAPLELLYEADGLPEPRCRPSSRVSTTATSGSPRRACTRTSSRPSTASSRFRRCRARTSSSPATATPIASSWVCCARSRTPCSSAPECFARAHEAPGGRTRSTRPRPRSTRSSARPLGSAGGTRGRRPHGERRRSTPDTRCSRRGHSS